jgi:hypothetical protein
VHRRLPAGNPVDIEKTMQSQWKDLELANKVQGKQIAIGVGSRGVAEIPHITRCLVNLIRAADGNPFVIPAMGSHGGATPEGQIAVLGSLGVTEVTVGCPVRATMDTVVLGQTKSGLAVYMDRLGAEADGLFIINRVKIHTDFSGRHESGLMKMLAIGLGNQTGAAQLHDFGVHGLRALMPEVAAASIEHGNLLAGIATVEDGYHRPVRLDIIPRNKIQQREPELLDYSRSLMPSLAVKDIDVLIVDRIGKEISGSGMDTNLIGRRRIDGEPEPESPRIKAMAVLDLTEASHGNATGIGLADFTVRRLLEKIDFDLFAQNVLTSGFLQRGNIPLVFETDQDAIEAAIMSVRRRHTSGNDHLRMMRIRDTMELETLWVSPSLLEEVKADPGFVSDEPAQALVFTSGHLF